RQRAQGLEVGCARQWRDAAHRDPLRIDLNDISKLGLALRSQQREGENKELSHGASLGRSGLLHGSGDYSHKSCALSSPFSFYLRWSLTQSVLEHHVYRVRGDHKARNEDHLQ